MTRTGYIVIIATILTTLAANAPAVQRFPPPDFETGHQQPELTTPPARQGLYEYIDSAVLFAALILGSYLVLKKRNRRLIFSLMVFSLLYFGFWRKGCICSIGAIGNVVLSIFETDYAIPLAGLLFFVLPIVVTMFFGRIFCGSVCPLGAIQDLVLFKPVAVPAWLEHCLRLLGWCYLALAVLFAATGSAFIICRYDPFIAFFRLGGNVNIVVLGICFLLVGIFVGRPYCRYFCPYGIILRQFSRISKHRVSITPDECINCRLCEDSCPFGAIQKPTDPWPQSSYVKSKIRLGVLILLLPFLTILGGFSMSRLDTTMAQMHPTVRLAQQITLEETGKVTEVTDATTAFRASGSQIPDLYQQASSIRGSFTTGTWLTGSFLGLLIGLKLIRLSVRFRRDDYRPDRAGCLACGRCYQYCPVEQQNLVDTKKKTSE